MIKQNTIDKKTKKINGLVGMGLNLDAFGT
jgi:hypothetical protein